MEFSPSATAIPWSERNAESTPAPALNTIINSTLCGQVRLLLQHLQGPVGPQGPAGPQRPVGPHGHDGLQGPAGPPGIKVKKEIKEYRYEGFLGYKVKVVPSYFSGGVCLSLIQLQSHMACINKNDVFLRKPFHYCSALPLQTQLWKICKWSCTEFRNYVHITQLSLEEAFRFSEDTFWLSEEAFCILGTAALQTYFGKTFQMSASFFLTHTVYVVFLVILCTVMHILVHMYTQSCANSDLHVNCVCTLSCIHMNWHLCNICFCFVSYTHCHLWE